MENKPHDRSPKIFLSYAHSDRFKVEQIAAALQATGVSVWLDGWELALGDSIVERVERAVKASDVFLVFLSAASIGSQWIRAELGHALTRQMCDRAITIVPVMIEDCEIPPQLAGLPYINLSYDWSAGVEKLRHQISRAPDIDPLKIDAEAFEQLARDLLLALDYSVSVSPTPAGPDNGIDFIATQNGGDPSDPNKQVVWMVEVKAYRQGRVSVDTVKQLLRTLASTPAGTNGMLVTNGHVTSVAQEFLSEALAETKRRIRVIDGSELKTLLLKHPHLVSRYFPPIARS